MLDLVVLTHSVLRYFILIFLLIVIVRSLLGWQQKSAYTPLDDKFSLWLFIFTHTQLLFGLIQYFVSPVVIFSGASMKDPIARYWLVEHGVMMLIAIVLITVARITAKKMTETGARHKRLFIFNALALIIILVAIAQSGRGFFSFPT
ncbi:MAG: cytochrome B [Cyclobacteriaceae bacterium]|nr:cytochrome B [Cyclobacteriaceae bacterium]